MKKHQRIKHDSIKWKISQIFKREKEIVQAVADCRAMTDSHRESETQGHAFISDPTANTAIRHLQEIKQVILDDGFYVDKPEQWLRVIRATYANMLSDEYRSAFKLRCGGVHFESACQRLGMSPSMYYTATDKGYNYATAAACQLGLVKVM